MEYRLYAIIDQDNLVVNCLSWNVDNDIHLLINQLYSDRYNVIEFSADKSITNTQASVGLYYDSSLNAFIPKKPGDDYVLDEESYIWVPVSIEAS